MKRISLWLVSAILITMIACTSSKQSDLRHQLEQLNSECPVAMDAAGHVTGTYYNIDDSIVTFNLSLNLTDSIIDFCRYAYRDPNADMDMVASFIWGQYFNEQFLNPMIEAGASLRIEYTDTKSDKSGNFTITLDELKSSAEEIATIKADSTSVHRMVIECAITKINEEMPMDYPEGYSINGLGIDGNDIVVLVIYDPKKIDFSDIDPYREGLIDLFREFLKYGGITSNVKSSGMAGKYIFYDGKGNTYFTISPETIAKF